MAEDKLNIPKTWDPLDMDQYKIEKLPKREKKGFELFLTYIGPVLAILLFVLIAYVFHLPFLENLSLEDITAKGARENFDKIGSLAFSRSNILMLAIFVAGIVLWMTESIPNYLTSLIIIISLVLTGVLPQKMAYAQLGHPVMWLNIMSFVLASMLVKTGLAKRFALWFLLKFGKNASSIFLSFIVINIVLSSLISATTAKAAILLPIFMVIAAIYGARGGDEKTNFGRSIVLQNLLYINIGASGFLTGSGANLLAIALIAGATGGNFLYSEWLTAMFPMMLCLMLIGYLLAMKVFFPLTPEERIPSLKGGMETLRAEYNKMGKFRFEEYKALILFLLILGFWATDWFHHIDPTTVAFLGAIIALLPRIGIIKWNDVDIPWHLMLFSAGAYTLGAGLDNTDLPAISVNAFFDHLGIGADTPFWILYLFLTAIMVFSALIFQSKTMRAMIFIPIAIGVANRFGFSVLSLALPVAFMIEHVYVLPFNSKPAALLYETGHYTIGNTFKFGLTVMIIAWILNIVAGETWFRMLGITPDGVFNFW